GSPGPRTKRLTPTCASSSPTRSVTKPRGPRSHHFISRRLRTNQLTAGTIGELRAQAVEHDVEIAPPLAGRGCEQRRADERPHLRRLEIPPHRAGTLRSRNDLPSELLELCRARLLTAMDDAPVQAGRAHRELGHPPDEVEERLARVVGRERLLGHIPHLRDVALDDR